MKTILLVIGIVAGFIGLSFYSNLLSVESKSPIKSIKDQLNAQGGLSKNQKIVPKKEKEEKKEEKQTKIQKIDKTQLKKLIVEFKPGQIKFHDFLRKKPPLQKDYLALVAEVTPPEVDGKFLQASQVSVRNHSGKKLLYASYSMIGEKFIGALQIIEVKEKDEKVELNILQTKIFPNFDIHSLLVKNNFLYLVGGTGDEKFKSPARLEILSLNSNGLVDDALYDNDHTYKFDLPSYAATSVIKIKDYVVVTVGDQGGGVIFIKSPTNLEIQKIHNYQEIAHDFYEIHDARYLAYDKNYVYCLKGQDAGLWIFDRKKKRILDTVDYQGATMPESKSTVEVIGDKIFMALGDGGGVVASSDNFKPLYKIPMYTDNKLDYTKTVTNAMTAGRNEIFTADGEAGIRYFKYKDGSKNVQLMDEIRFKEKQSVNAIKYHQRFLFVASGMGGVKIVKLFRKNKGFDYIENVFYKRMQNRDERDDDSNQEAEGRIGLRH